MTYKVLKSAITSAQIADFGAEVKEHIEQLEAWETHHALVRTQPPLAARPVWGDFAGHDDPAHAFMVENEKWENAKLTHRDTYPRPLTHPLIDAAVRQDGDQFIADHEIVDDDPTGEQVLREKKFALLQKVYIDEEAAKEQVQPPLGKRRLFNLMENDIRNADTLLTAKIIDETPEAERMSLDIVKELTKRRDPKDTKHLEDQGACRANVDAITRSGAQIMHDIEDLTLDDIDSYQIPNLG